MISKKRLQWIGGVVLVMWLLVGCGVASVKPHPGATFTGPLELIRSGTNGEVGGGELEITIAEDGTGISSVSFTLSNMNCSNESGSINIASDGISKTTTFSQPAAIANGKFELDIGGIDEEINIDGLFTSPTEANATIQISTTTTVAPPGTSLKETISCDYGSWNWSGEVK
ncbi:MAG: hypothetical protein A2Z16_01035 [Chloroflexi bacterium RBG_16_54_18]|nr:MAG: hypothetical protein A2Z16_01035 [Chloroflexi bacterium RBG_16_54_18]